MGKKLPQSFAADTVIKLAVISLVTVSNIYHSTYFYGGSTFLNQTKHNNSSDETEKLCRFTCFLNIFSHSVFHALFIKSVFFFRWGWDGSVKAVKPGMRAIPPGFSTTKSHFSPSEVTCNHQ